jgi:hypothetical protein
MWVILAAAALLMPPDEPAAKLAGSRVRLTTRSVGTTGGDTAKAKPLIGTLAGLDEHMLTLALRSGEKVVVPADRILRLERLVKPSSRKKGAGIGAAVLGGAALALVGWVCASDWGCEGADPVRVAAFVLVPAAIGATLGTSASYGERWRDVPLATTRTTGCNRIRLGVGPTSERRGLAASVSLTLF